MRTYLKAMNFSISCKIYGFLVWLRLNQFSQLFSYIQYMSLCVFSLPNKPVSQMRALLAACHKLALGYDTLANLLYVLDIKRNKF